MYFLTENCCSYNKFTYTMFWPKFYVLLLRVQNVKSVCLNKTKNVLNARKGNNRQ